MNKIYLFLQITCRISLNFENIEEDVQEDNSPFTLTKPSRNKFTKSKVQAVQASNPTLLDTLFQYKQKEPFRQDTSYTNTHPHKDLYNTNKVSEAEQTKINKYQLDPLTSLQKQQMTPQNSFLTHVSLQGLVNDEISWFGEKQKAMRDFVTATNSVTREKPMQMVVRITSLYYKKNEKDRLQAFVRCPFDGTKKYTHFSVRDWTYCKIMTNENKIVTLYNFRDFEIEIQNSQGTKYNVVTLSELDLNTLLQGRKYGKVYSKIEYMKETVGQHRVFKARFLIYVFNTLLKKITNTVPNFVKETDLGLENDQMKLNLQKQQVNTWLHRVGKAKIDLCLTPDIANVSYQCNDYQSIKEKVKTAELVSENQELLQVEFQCPHKQNGYCTTGCFTTEDALTRKAQLLVYLRRKLNVNSADSTTIQARLEKGIEIKQKAEAKPEPAKFRFKTQQVYPDLMAENIIIQDLHCFNDEYCSFRILDLEMKSEAMQNSFYNLDIMRNDTFNFEKEVMIKDVGQLKIKFLQELHIEDQEKCLKL